MTPEEIELLGQLTIVIPTYNRPLELERSIEYWRDTPVTVHILDGSDKPWLPVGVLAGAPNIFLPGSRIPIVSEDRLKLDKPDYVVIFPWNLSTEITGQLDYLDGLGTVFIVAVPILSSVPYLRVLN